MLHPAQRICASEGKLYYAISDSVYCYDQSTRSIKILWTAGPLNEQEKAKNIEHRAICEITTYKHFLVWIAEDKVLRVYDLNHQILLSEREFTKRGCALSVADDLIVVGDKFGDVYSFPLIESSGSEAAAASEAVEKLPILGHVSMLTAVALTHTSDADPQRFIITADRDEHIRVSQFPDGHNIQAYCLGHAQFLSCLLIPARHPELLISAGGDDYLAFWDWKNGSLLEKRQLDVPVQAAQKANTGLAVLKIVDVPTHDSFIMVAENLPHLFVFSTDRAISEAKCIDLSLPVLDLAVDKNDLWIAYDTTAGTDTSPLFDHFELTDLFKTTDEPRHLANELSKLNEKSRTIVDTMGYTVHKFDLMRKRTKTELEAIRLANPANKQKTLGKKRGGRKNGRSMEQDSEEELLITKDEPDEETEDQSDLEQAPFKKAKRPETL